MKLSNVRACVGIAIAFQLGNASAETWNADPISASIYEERGITSSAPLVELESSDGWKDAEEVGPWNQYLSRSQSLGLIDLKGTYPLIYPPVRCATNGGVGVGSDFCHIPIKLTAVQKIDGGWRCVIGIPSVVHGTGVAYIEDAGGRLISLKYKLKWEIDDLRFDHPDEVVGVVFSEDGISMKKKNASAGSERNALIRLDGGYDSRSGKIYVGTFSGSQRRAGEFYYDVRMDVLVRNKSSKRRESCIPVDPVVVNTD